jgi:hypothetical protein
MAATVAPEAVPEIGERAVSLPAVVAMAWSAVAAALHLVVVPAHLAEAWYLGTFFIAVGAAQLLLAVLVRRPLPSLALLAGIWGNVVVVALYVASRSVDLWFLPATAHGPQHLPVAGGIGNGIPVLPGARMEPIGALDLTCLLAELLVVAMLMTMLPARLRARTGTALVTVTLVGVAAVALRLS